MATANPAPGGTLGKSTFMVATLIALAITLPAICSEASDTVTDSGTLGGDQSHAYDINDSGQITEEGRIGAIYDAFPLTPVPEPSSVVLAALSLVGLAGNTTRRVRISPNSTVAARDPILNALRTRSSLGRPAQAVGLASRVTRSRPAWREGWDQAPRARRRQ
jgi:hypothetical protein